MKSPKFNRMSSLIISCADARYIHMVDEFIQRGFQQGSYYKILFPGSSLAFHTCPDAMNYCLGLFLPIVESIHIIDHHDCAAYKDAYQTQDTDQKTHIENLRDAIRAIRKMKDDIPIYTYLFNLDGSAYSVSFSDDL